MCGLRAFRSQLPDLLGHHGKAFSGAPGPGRFNRCVDGQNASLESDVLDVAGDLRDLLGIGTNVGHGCRESVHVRICFLNALSDFLSLGSGLIAAVCNAIQPFLYVGYLVYQFFCGLRLLYGCLMQLAGLAVELF